MKIIPSIILSASLLILSMNAELLAHENSSSKMKEYPENSAVDTEAGKVITKFHEAIKLGDKKQARYLLDENVVIYEGGRVEKSADEYAQHHMLADMKYLASIKIDVLEQNVRVVGDTAYSMSRTQLTGQVKGKYINQENMETMVLLKKDGQWKITHIHWSN